MTDIPGHVKQVIRALGYPIAAAAEVIGISSLNSTNVLIPAASKLPTLSAEAQALAREGFFRGMMTPEGLIIMGFVVAIGTTYAWISTGGGSSGGGSNHTSTSASAEPRSRAFTDQVDRSDIGATTQIRQSMQLGL